MRKFCVGLMVVCLLALGGQAVAEMCTVDAVPAATLLLPYYEVYLGPPGSGVTTLFSVNNASMDPALAHVIVWTNWSAPVIDFDIFLTGYDVVTFNVWDFYHHGGDVTWFEGDIPITADEQSDPLDTISPHGIPPHIYADNPHFDGSFTGCAAFFPFFNNPMIRGTAYERLYYGTLGLPVPSLAWGCGAGSCCLGDPCFDDDDGDGIPDGACGYITIDNVSQCSLILDPGDITYFFNGGLGIANDINQLWGDYFIVDPANAYAFGDTLVHIEADPLFDGLPTNYTFYGRYVLGDGRDDREPLGTTWATRYLNGGPFSGGTDLLVWRDSTADNLLPAGALCGVGPDWFPLNETEVIVFDETEDAVEICFFTGGLVSPPDDEDPPCFPYETGRYSLGVHPLDIPFNFGWIYLNLNLPVDAPTGDVDFPLPAGLLAQSYVTAEHSALGLYTVGLSAIELSSACEDLNPLINVLPTVIPYY